MKVIVVGGGIGGLAVAIGLRRAGHQVKVFERSSFLREVGAAINICPNAGHILLRWGFDVKLARLVAARRSLVVQGSSLKQLVEVDCTPCAERYGAPWYLAHRVDLHSELRRLATCHDAPGCPVEIVLRSEVVTYDAEGGSVTLADQSVHYADIVVAADGVHTAAAHQVMGHATPAVSTGSAAFRFLIPTETLLEAPETASLPGDGLMRIFVGDGLRRVVWYPCANNTIQNFVGIHPDDASDGREMEDWDRSADINDLLSQYHDFHPTVLTILKKATTIKRWPLLYRDPIPTWRRGRLVLIGDAAHPMLPHQGQGGAQAIEDAGALSVLFSGLPESPSQDEITNRLKLFEKVRIKRASAMQILSNAGQDEAWKVRERAKQYMPEGVEVPTSPPEYMRHNFGYNVLEDSEEQLRLYLESRS